MPPKAAPQPIQQPQVLQDTLGMNPEYLLPHQRDQYRKAFQTMNDLQSRKAKDPDNAVLDNAITEARKQLSTLAQQASNQQKVFPTPELFKAFATKAHQFATQRSQNPAAVSAAVSSPDHIRKLQLKALQFSNRLAEIENTLGGPADLSEDTKNNLRSEYQNIYSQQEIAREILRLAAVQMQSRVAQASGNTAGGQTETTNTQAQAPAPSQQPATPPISQPATPRNIASLPATAQALPTPTQSMGSIPRPSVITGNQPVRPTLSGGFSVGNPLLGTSTPVSLPNAFQLAQDGETRLLSKRKLQDLARSIDPDERLEPDVEDLLMEVADEFIESVLQQSCKIAKHRKGQMLEVRDVQLHLERNWNIRIPGYTSEEVRNVKKYNPTPAHAAKLGAVNQAKAMTKDTQ